VGGKFNRLLFYVSLVEFLPQNTGILNCESAIFHGFMMDICNIFSIQFKIADIHTPSIRLYRQFILKKCDYFNRLFARKNAIKAKEKSKLSSD
jgi:hypothetical protein